MNIHISKTPGKKIFGYTLLVNFWIFFKTTIYKYGILYVLEIRKLYKTNIYKRILKELWGKGKYFLAIGTIFRL